MKKLIVFLFVAMIGMTSSANNMNANPKTMNDEIRTKIVKLLGKVQVDIDKKEVKTTIDFVINKNGEIVILDIESANEDICLYIKSKLNYKKVANKTKRTSKVYKMPLRIVK